MIATLKSEFLKLFTLRSTYITALLAVVILGFFAFYLEGYSGTTGSAASELMPEAYQEIISNAAGVVAVFVTIIAVMMMAHEFRYNTIVYTLTANTHRTRVLIAKTVATVVFGVLFGLVMVLVALGFYQIGLTLRDATLPTQDIDALYMLGKTAFYFATYALVGLLLATLLKSVIGAISVFFIAPITVEPLLSLLLKDNSVYLPFTMFDSIMRNGLIQSDLSTVRILTVSAAYLAVTWVITWLLFLKRDAN